LGNSLKEQGNLREALEAYNKAFASDNSNIKARWAHCMSQIPVLYSDQSSIELSRKKYSEELRDLVESIPLKTRSDVENAALAVGAHTPFYLAYQGFNDRDLQKVYGNLVCHVMALRYPEHANRPTMPPLLADKAMKVGFVSAFFFRHASWKFPTKGWVENIDKCGFSLHGYYTGNIKDEETAVARRYFSRFIEDIYQVDKLSEIIRNDNLHILIYPEIGMDPITVRLAALRLAPIQCVSWGHAATSGFPTMDYFLSGEDLEPANAEEHYSECLIRLPNLSISYSPPGLPPTRMNRETFDLASGSVLYHCCQSLFKFLPKYDEIFPRIAQQVENSTFLFIRDKSIFLTEKFCSRINKAFKTFKLDPDKYVIFRDHLAPEQYYAINCLADVYLDPIGWSGCNSAFEAIEANLPIVTWPSQFMIGRISSAVLTTMGIKETVAESIDEYVEIAVKLGKDAELRNYLTERIAANKHFLYHDRTCITGLQDFFKRVVKETLL
jgi:protein O-GlcNAc transferase